MSSRPGLRASWLLLLPNPPTEITLRCIKGLYASTVSQVLRKTADVSVSLSTVTILDIAVPCPESSDPRKFHYSYLQNLLWHLYTLVGLLCTEHSIDVEYGNDVDVRVILFQSPDLDSPQLYHDDVQGSRVVGAPVTLRRLASCDRAWQRVCSVSSVNGEALLQRFLQLRKSSFQEDVENLVIERFAAPSFMDVTSTDAHGDESRAHHNSVAVGGTFDHLHIGHKLLLSMTAVVLAPLRQSAARQQRSITVGITGDKLLTNKNFREYLEDWHQRQAAVRGFLLAFLVMDMPSQQIPSDSGNEGEGIQQRTITDLWPSGFSIRYIEIFDAFGPTITDESITALALSEETRAGGKAVNDKRAEKGWPPLDVFEVGVLDLSVQDAGASKEEMQDFHNKISSTEIRRRLGARSGTAAGKTPMKQR
ncbi:MAG: hypothetical protein LQ338_006985 [Usnochroma carphineum]|nr:MAG: hypothetical protein LQ338_006985 [Usnochroma carphineum]